jgi:hypothetical protein
LVLRCTTKSAHWFSAFHAAFCEVQRPRDDTWTLAILTISPLKAQPTPGTESSNGSDAAPARQKRPRSAAVVSVVDTDSGDENALEEQGNKDETENGQKEDASASGVPKIKRAAAGQVEMLRWEKLFQITGWRLL